MVVTCPSCRARYAVDPQKIGFAGRIVQCARCSHRWFEKVERPPAAPAPAPEVVPATEPKPAFETATASAAASENAAAFQSTASTESAAAPPPLPAPEPVPEEPVPEMVIRPTTRGAGLPAVIPPRASPWRRGAIAAVVALLLVGGGLFALRDQIDALIAEGSPAAAPTTAAQPATPPPASQRPQIEIDLSKSKIEVVEGRYMVHGEVVNRGTAAGSTSQLRVVFKRNDEVLGEKTFPLVQGPLKPGDRATFSQVLEDPPAGTTDIVPVVE